LLGVAQDESRHGAGGLGVQAGQHVAVGVHRDRDVGMDPALQPLANRLVIEITHATYGVGDEPLEAVVSVRPAVGNVIVFETYEGPAGEDEDDELATAPEAPATSERTPP
jgi:hypothetical protein